MSIYFDDTSNEHLESNSIPCWVPVTMACWFKTDSLTLNQYLMKLTYNPTNNFHALQVRGDQLQRLWAQTYGPGAAQAISSTAWTTNTWHHAAAVFTSYTYRAVWLNGGSKGTDSSAVNVTQADYMKFGDNTRCLSGYQAEAAMWNIALTDAEVLMLSKGLSPLCVRPQYLVAYWPLVRGGTNYEPDIVGTCNMSYISTPDVGQPHPKIFYPRRYR